MNYIPRYPQRKLFIKSQGDDHKPEAVHKASRVKRSKIRYPKGLEGDFLKNSENKFIMSVGCKHSGKSYTLLRYIKWALDNNVFDEYWLVLPTFEFEQNDSYSWLSEHPAVKSSSGPKLVIYDSWDPLIIERIKKRPRPYSHMFLGIDDSTGSWRLIADAEELKFNALLRHFNVTQWVVLHVCRAGLPSSLRALIDFLFVYLNPNRKGLEAMYEEYLSLVFPTFKEFLEVYKKEVLGTQYNSILIFTRDVGKYDTNVKGWSINQVEL